MRYSSGKRKIQTISTKVPIQSEIIDGRGMPIHVSPVPGLVKQNKQNTDADDHVQGVHAGHGKVEEEKELRVLRHIRRQRNIPLVGGMDKVFHAEAGPRYMVFHVLLVILNRLDAKKNQPQTNRKAQRSNQPLAVAGLRRIDAHGHGEAGEDKNRCIGGSEADAQRIAAGHKGVVIPVAIEQVGHEQPAEEHDFGQQKQPHAEAGGLPLLIHRNEMVAQVRGMRLVHFVRFLVSGDDRLAIQQSLPHVQSYEPTSHSRTLRDP